MGVNPMIQRNLMLAGFIVFMLGLGGTGVIASSLPFIRDRMRVHYRLEVPPFYDSLPADTEEHRQRVIKLLEANDQLKADMNKALAPAPTTAPAHGRTLTGKFGIIPDGGEPLYRPYRLSDGPDFFRRACHSEWGWGDGWLDLCRDVDRSVAAAIHYEDDVETYWTIRLRPLRFPPP